MTALEVRQADLAEQVGRRVGVTETRLRELRGAEEEHRSIEDRLTALEQAATAERASARGRRDRIWVLALALISGLLLPLVTTVLITFLHVRSH